MAGATGSRRGRAAALLVLVAVLAGLGVAWYNWHRLGDVWDQVAGNTAEITPELASQADEKLTSLGEDQGADRIALGESELGSLIEYRWSGFLPADVVDPRIGVSDGRITLEGSVATARFRRIPELRDIGAFLPDTAELRAVGSIVPLDGGGVALEVHELGAAGIPIPGQLIPGVLAKLGGARAPGLGANTIVLPLPPGIRSVFVSGDSLVLLANRAEGG